MKRVLLAAATGCVLALGASMASAQATPPVPLGLSTQQGQVEKVSDRRSHRHRRHWRHRHHHRHHGHWRHRHHHHGYWRPHYRYGLDEWRYWHPRSYYRYWRDYY